MGANPPPGHHPTLMHWCEYASRVTASARLGIPPGWRGAGWPENRVWARSKLPHQKWTGLVLPTDRKSTRLNSSHGYISYAVFCLKKKKKKSVKISKAGVRSK